MTSNRNGNVLEAGEKDAPVKINCLKEDPSSKSYVNENVTHEKEVAKSSRIMKATVSMMAVNSQISYVVNSHALSNCEKSVQGENQKNVIGPSNLNAQQVNVPLTGRTSKTTQGLTESESKSSALSLRKATSEKDT